jgi:hypothetical protein
MKRANLLAGLVLVELVAFGSNAPASNQMTLGDLEKLCTAPCQR